jgi:hypothetical protein
MKNLHSEYLEDAELNRTLAQKESGKLFLLSMARLATFIGGFALSWFAFSVSLIAGSITVTAIVALFLFLLKSYSDHTARREYLENMATINANEAKAVTGDFSMFEDGKGFMSAGHDFTYDIDIFGLSSLYQYINRTCTGYGSQVLAGWLADPYSVSSIIAERQKAVRELAGKKSWRQSFLASGMGKSLTTENISGISRWLQKESFPGKSAFMRLIIWILPAFTIISFILMAAGLIHYYFFIALFILNAFIIFFNLKRSSAVHEELTGRFRYLSSLEKLIGVFESEAFESDLIRKMKEDISGGTRTASASLHELGTIIRAFDSRLNVIAGTLLNGILLWDLHCIRRLDKWKQKHREQFPVWLTNLGEIDSLISLGNYAFNNPGFAFPSVSSDGTRLDAKDLGHPLIKGNVRVTNDFRFPAKGNIFIISGANMAGKSTFLRSVAVNLILAMTGAPVCATEFSFTPVRLFTSMRTVDSLSSNESYFYAELKRLRNLEQKLQSEEETFFILDEILKGTNSDDKSQGSRMFLSRIIALGGTGMIATHDTSLGTMEKEYPDRIINKCIEVDIDGEKISFDYKLHDGIASKRNAVLLMRQMGIIT